MEQKRKHYAYLFKDIGQKRLNILISSKPRMIEKKHKKNHIKEKITINIPLHSHPCKEKQGCYYLIPVIYLDDVDSFDQFVLTGWSFHKNDKRMVKRLKRLIKNRLRHH